jgi:hypothetical protein
MAKFLEDNLQMAVARILDMNRVLWCHVANERKTRSQRIGGILRAKGVKSGVPDCLIFEPRGGFSGLALELKVEHDQGYTKKGKARAPRRGKLTENQKHWLEELSKRNWKTAVAYNIDEAIKELEDYLQIKMT